MPRFTFTVTAEASVSAQVTVDADTIEEAQAIAIRRSFYEDPVNATFRPDENAVRDVYIPDPADFECVGGTAPPGM